jgi:GNAT superfamily N-acetyltransferase
MNIRIRHATSADVPTLVKYNAALALESEGKVLDLAVLEKGVRAALADPAKGFYVIAERDGDVIGQTGVTFEWSDWRNGWYWWIQSVFVREDARRGGVFSAIYRHLEAEAAADPGVIGLRLYVDNGNHNAKATYAKLGLEDENYSLMGRYPLPGRTSHIAGVS